MVNLVRKVPHDVKKSCDAAGFLTEKELIRGLVDDKFLLGGGIVSAPEDVNVIRTMVDQNKKDMKVPVQMPSHRQHVYYILGKRPGSEGSSDSTISFFDDDLEGEDLPYNDALVISLNVGDHEVNRILVDLGSLVNVMCKNLFKILNMKPKDLKQTDILMFGFNEVAVRPMGIPYTVALHHPAWNHLTIPTAPTPSLDSPSHAVMHRLCVRCVSAFAATRTWAIHALLRCLLTSTSKVSPVLACALRAPFFFCAPRVRRSDTVHRAPLLLLCTADTTSLLLTSSLHSSPFPANFDLPDSLKVNLVGVSRHRAFTGCLPRRTANLVCKVPHDVKKSCDAAGFLTEKVCIVSAPEDVNVIRTMVDQNKKDMKEPVQMPSHRQHVYYILGKRPRSEGSSNSTISFSDDDFEGVDLPYNDALVISLNVGDHKVNRILVDPGSSVNVMYKNLFKILNMKPEDLKQTDILMSGFNEVAVRPIGKVNPVGVSRHRAFTGCLPRRTVNLVRKVPHDVKKSCDAAGFLTKKEFIRGLVDDKFLLGGGIVSAPEDVNVIRTMVAQNKKDMKEPVQMPSHRQHVYYILGKRPRSEGSSNSTISFSDDDFEGVDLPHNDALVISLNVGDHKVNRILVDPGGSVYVMYKNLFKIFNLKLEDLKQTGILMSGFNEVSVRPMGVVSVNII
ncbi:unnamed protein product [Camellia sinensis]